MRRILLCCSLLPVATGSAEVQSLLQVRAAVAPRTDIEVQAPALLRVVAADLERSMPQVSQPVHIRAYSNTPHGLEVNLQAPQGMFAGLRIQAPGVDAQLAGDGGAFVWRWSRHPGFKQPATLEMTVTFSLLPSTPPGNHSWPLRISAQALAQ